MQKAFGSKLTAISLVALDPFSGVDFYYISPVVKIILLKHVLMQKNSRKVKAYVLKKALMQRLKSSKVKFLQMVFLKAVEDLGSDLIVIGSHGRKGFQN